MPTAARSSRAPTVVLLVRHGVTPTTGVTLPGRAPGLHLSDEGRRQAEATAARIGRLRRVAAVYTSPLERARETAAPIARARGLRMTIERGLLEVDVGEWTGASLARVRGRREWEIVQRHPSGFRFPGGESFTEMQARIVGALTRLAQRHRGATVVAVSHADPIKAAVAHAVGAPLDLFQRVVVSPASVTAIAYGLLGASLLTLNSLGDDLGALGGL